MTLQLSRAAQTLGVQIPCVATSNNEELFDIIYKELFPRDDDNPNLAQIFNKDLYAGIGALNYLEWPLQTDNTRIVNCLMRMLDEVLHHPKVWKVAKSVRPMRHIATLLRHGRVKSLPMMIAVLEKHRRSLLKERDQLEGLPFAIAKLNATSTLWRPEPYRKPMPPEEQPSLFDVPALEDVHRRLRLVDNLQDALSYLSRETTDWRTFAYKTTGILRAGWGMYDRHRRAESAPLFWKNGSQEAAAKRLIGSTFLNIYGNSGLHGKTDWLGRVWN